MVGGGGEKEGGAFFGLPRFRGVLAGVFLGRPPFLFRGESVGNFSARDSPSRVSSASKGCDASGINLTPASLVTSVDESGLTAIVPLAFVIGRGVTGVSKSLSGTSSATTFAFLVRSVAE